MQTDSGYTLAQAIASGIKNPDSAIGIYAGDAQSYTTFSLVFDPIISEYHGLAKSSLPSPDMKLLSLPALDLEGNYIKSTRIRIARNLKGFNFPCHMALSERRELEKKTIRAFRCLNDAFKGQYNSLEQMDKKKGDLLKRKILGFKKGDRFQDAAGFNSDFPKSRGVYHSSDKKFRVWVNEEDHLRLISMEKTSDLSKVYNRLCQAFLSLNTCLDFAWNKTHGYLTSCPTNLGTAMRAGVHIQLEKLGHKKNLLFDLTKAHNLQIRGTQGEKTRIQNNIFDISNRQRLGISESRIIQTLHTGLRAIIKAEKSL